MDRKYIFIAGGVLALLVLGIGLLDYSGYVLNGPYIVKGGTVVVEDILPGTKIFINNKKEAEAGANETSTSVRGLPSGTHSIIVAHDDAWPWLSEFEANIAQETTVRPVLVPREPNGSVITKDDERFAAARELLEGYTLPTREEPLTHEGGAYAVWADGNSVFARDGSAEDSVPFAVFTSEFPVKSASWYKGHADVLLLAASDSIFTLDVEEKDVRNFQPVYKGVGPSFVVNPENNAELFVDDGGHTLILYLDIGAEKGVGASL
ncbi:MAG: hypothetical protein Q8P16_01735 [bacterium]|nr:hypothetical protein [bacterium]